MCMLDIVKITDSSDKFLSSNGRRFFKRLGHKRVRAITKREERRRPRHYQKAFV